MNLSDSHARDYDSDSDMPCLQERVQEDESSDDNSEDKQYHTMLALGISERNRSDSSSDDNSEGNNNNDDDEWNLLKSNSCQQATTHYKFTPVR